MKILLDFLPVIVFFAVYKFTNDILLATAVLIPATLLQMLYSWKVQGKIEKMQLVTLVLVVLLGGATLAFQDKAFIQWKPTIVNWLFAVGFLATQFIGDKTVVERLMGSSMELPKAVWSRLNLAWVVFFVAVGIVNLYVAYNFSEEIWVDFKLFGMLGLTILFIILQGLYIAKHAKEPEAPTEK
ncbi:MULTISPECIES: septation protein A [unclassified Marinobacterium]|jgi:intracellular septation protein|uniref:septation protein A n=1 Tax=unclassified Marinobacterium TaxID=2644139 RepID=UPI00156832B9|nr:MULTISPECIES: septation protein A [unclassified Marinobacterium]NRP10350.1 putative intracellular septation protein A [Marinobacterium sp. xm-g-48]NRP28338.1 putative intracellular septation protein A [Marinobacterium sp. xm-d-420]NRP37241.1 putative intracellular septation protein A [Marinobacterium sp. xm-d-579]NRP38165.1 putative intracellular septation protein A [Marinobacterium sp. xm-a-121]NRP46948.1 putative intracellular septation protein A [Marinobacterium sp. xm-d-543]